MDKYLYITNKESKNTM